MGGQIEGLRVFKEKNGYGGDKMDAGDLSYSNVAELCDTLIPMKLELVDSRDLMTHLWFVS